MASASRSAPTENDGNHIRFSVIIPVFNGEPTISRAIESVIVQSYPAHEIIVVDDGSTDHTAEVVRGFGSDVRYYVQQNAGVSAARNTGVNHATGDWIAFLDSDDWYYRDRLLLHQMLLKERSDLSIASGDYDYCDSDATVLHRSVDMTAYGRELAARARDVPALVIEGDELERFIDSYFGHTLSFSIRRDLFTKLDGFPVGYPVGEDVQLVIRACAASPRVGIVTRPMGAYVVHDAGAIRRDPMRAQEEAARVFRDLRKSLRDAPPPVIRGWKTKMRAARLDLAIRTLREGGRAKALCKALPLVWECPSIRSVLDLVSVVRG